MAMTMNNLFSSGRILKHIPKCKFLIVLIILTVLFYLLIGLLVSVILILSSSNEDESNKYSSTSSSAFREIESINNSDSFLSSTENHKFQQFDINKWQSQRFTLPESIEDYFITVGEDGPTCYKAGTDEVKSVSSGECVCMTGYHGPHCGIPSSAWFSYYKQNKAALMKLKPRKTPRRLIHGLQVNHEFDLTETRLNMLKDVVDVYLLLESNYNAYGSEKPLLVLEKFRQGWMSKLQENILYIYLDFFPEKGLTDGWYADHFLRNYLGTKGMAMLDNVRDDDVFLLLDADELPTVEALMFLKLFDGWSEPVKFGFRWSDYGFFWLKSKPHNKAQERLLELYVASTVGMLRDVYDNNAMSLRRNLYRHERDRLKKYTKNHEALREWTLGQIGHYAGWHCSWCFDPQGIKLKLESAQRADLPRWGDYPEKLDLGYIENLINTGGWFDGSHSLISVDRDTTPTELYAPPYILENEEKFKYLLEKKAVKT